jgi:molybdopterin-guanine dinucleotide biosynthesis protein A
MPTPPLARRACAAAILDGGRATRLHGADKGGLLVGGRTIRDRQLDVLRGLVDDIFLVGAPADDRAARDRDPDRGAPGETPRVPDLTAGQGPLGGIQTALHRAGDAACTLIVACDLPFLSHDVLAHLVDRALARPADVDAVVPRRDGYLHPLCAAYNRRVRAAVDRRVAAGALAMRGLLDELRVDVIEDEALARFDPEGVLFWNVNTPDEYERACARATMA